MELVVAIVILLVFIIFGLRGNKENLRNNKDSMYSQLVVDELEYGDMPFKKEKYGSFCKTAKGEIVRSKGEKIIADFLFANGIEYGYEMRLGKFVPDFYLTQYIVIIEYWGMFHVEGIEGLKYRKKMRSKLGVYERVGIPTISLFPSDLNKLEHKILRYLHKMANPTKQK